MSRNIAKSELKWQYALGITKKHETVKRKKKVSSDGLSLCKISWLFIENTKSYEYFLQSQ